MLGQSMQRKPKSKPHQEQDVDQNNAKCELCQTNIVQGLISCSLCKATYHRYCTDLVDGEVTLVCHINEK